MLIGTKACFVLFSTNGNLGGQQNFSVPSAFEKIVFRKQIASTRVKYSFLKRTNPTTRTQPHRSHKGNCCIPVHRMHTLSSMHVFSLNFYDNLCGLHLFDSCVANLLLCFSGTERPLR